MKKLVQIIICFILILNSSNIYAKGLSVPSNPTISKNGSNYILTLKNKEDVLVNKGNIKIEIDVKSDISNWSSNENKLITMSLIKKDDTNFSISKNDLDSIVDKNSKGYTFRARYNLEGKTSDFSKEVSIGEFPAFKNASSWAINDLYKAQEMRIIPNTVLNDVSKNINREEFSELIVKTAEKLNIIKSHESETKFADASTSYPSKAHSIGVMTGYGENYFSSKSYLTREDLAVSISRLLKNNLKNKGITIKDISKASDYAVEPISMVVSNNLMNTQNELFAPKDNVTREQAISIMVRIYKLIEK